LTVEGIWQHLKSFLSKLVLDHVPHKMAKHKDKHSWVIIDIKKLIKKKDRLYKATKAKFKNLISRNY